MAMHATNMFVLPLPLFLCTCMVQLLVVICHMLGYNNVICHMLGYNNVICHVLGYNNVICHVLGYNNVCT